MSSRIEWVRGQARLLEQVRQEFETSRPFEGMTIGTGIHLEPKTAALLLTLQAGGARLVCTGNLNSTQPETVAYLRERDVSVIASQTQDPAEHGRNLRAVLREEPQILLDNGGDLFALYLEDRYDGLLGGTEETTSGRNRLLPLRDRLRVPILVINDSPIKQFAENEHAVGQSVLESFIRITNKMTNGTYVTVFGYGACGKGVAENFRGAGAQVSVVELDPVKRQQALIDGYSTPPRNRAVATADVIITVTGARSVVTASDLPVLKDGAILLNAGHFPVEIDVQGLAASPHVDGETCYEDTITEYRLDDGRRIYVLANGHMVNLAGPRPMGNSIESMDLGFTLQARCLEAVAKGEARRDECVVPVPRRIDERVATAYVELVYPGAQDSRLPKTG
jgi:adenosylhomocysteinase